MTEIELKNNYKEALKFEQEILDMLKESGSIRDFYSALSFESFIECEGEIMAFVKQKLEEIDMRKIYVGMVVAGTAPIATKSINDLSVNREKIVNSN